jgi:hypothetical protein
MFAQVLYLQNPDVVGQEVIDNRNHMTFRLDDGTTIRRIPVLRAARLIWIYFCLKYLREVHRLNGFIYSDWLAGDTQHGDESAAAVRFVNLLLQGGQIGLQVSIARDPRNTEADLLSDWFAWWCNGSLSSTIDQDLACRFDQLLDRTNPKIYWERYAALLNVRNAP